MYSRVTFFFEFRTLAIFSQVKIIEGIWNVLANTLCLPMTQGHFMQFVVCVTFFFFKSQAGGPIADFTWTLKSKSPALSLIYSKRLLSRSSDFSQCLNAMHFSLTDAMKIRMWVSWSGVSFQMAAGSSAKNTLLSREKYLRKKGRDSAKTFFLYGERVKKREISFLSRTYQIETAGF